MDEKKWIKIFFLLSFIFLAIVGFFNYIIDYYGIYGNNYFSYNQYIEKSKIRYIKSIKTRKIKPASIVLGTSRVEIGYTPTHQYFIQPAYNLANQGGSMYEEMKFFELALKQGNLKKVLLVLDYIMFIDDKQIEVPDFDTYFNDEKIDNVLLSIDLLKDTFNVILGEKNSIFKYTYGQHIYAPHVKNYFQYFKNYERSYYIPFSTEYKYGDTKRDSFKDLEKLLDLAYQNKVEVDIIFAPNHIRLWEALDYYLDYNKWLKWKKDILISINKIAEKYAKKQFKVTDFAVYHPTTSEEPPRKDGEKMKYHWEIGHYKSVLGSIVLDRLIGKSEFKDFGVELNLSNIGKHLEQQKIDRTKYIDTNKYQLEVFGKVKEK